MTDDPTSPNEFDFGESDEDVARRVLKRARARRKPLAQEQFRAFALQLRQVRERYVADCLPLDENGSASAATRALNALSTAVQRFLKSLTMDDGTPQRPGWLRLQAAAERVHKRRKAKVKGLRCRLIKERRRARDALLDAGQRKAVETEIARLRSEIHALDQEHHFFEAHGTAGTLRVLKQASRLVHLCAEDALKSEEDARQGADLSPEHRLILYRLPDLYGPFFGYEGIGTSQYLNDEGQPSSPFVDFVMAVLTEFDVKSNRDERFSRHTVANLLKKHRRTTRVIAASK